MSAGERRYPPLPPGAEVEVLAPGLARLSFPLPEPILPSSLTLTERDVALRVFQGASNTEIANARGVSAKTITKQLDAIYKKAGVTSRCELIARLLGG